MMILEILNICNKYCPFLVSLFQIASLKLLFKLKSQILRCSVDYLKIVGFAFFFTTYGCIVSAIELHTIV